MGKTNGFEGGQEEDEVKSEGEPEAYASLRKKIRSLPDVNAQTALLQRLDASLSKKDSKRKEARKDFDLLESELNTKHPELFAQQDNRPVPLGELERKKAASQATLEKLRASMMPPESSHASPAQEAPKEEKPAITKRHANVKKKGHTKGKVKREKDDPSFEGPEFEESKKEHDPLQRFLKEQLEKNPDDIGFGYEAVESVGKDSKTGETIIKTLEFSNLHDLQRYWRNIRSEEKRTLIERLRKVTRKPPINVRIPKDLREKITGDAASVEEKAFNKLVQTAKRSPEEIEDAYEKAKAGLGKTSSPPPLTTSATSPIGPSPESVEINVEPHDPSPSEKIEKSAVFSRPQWTERFASQKEYLDAQLKKIEEERGGVSFWRWTSEEKTAFLETYDNQTKFLEEREAWDEAHPASAAEKEPEQTVLEEIGAATRTPAEQAAEDKVEEPSSETDAKETEKQRLFEVVRREADEVIDLTVELRDPGSLSLEALEEKTSLLRTKGQSLARNVHALEMFRDPASLDVNTELKDVIADGDHARNLAVMTLLRAGEKIQEKREERRKAEQKQEPGESRVEKEKVVDPLIDYLHEGFGIPKEEIELVYTITMHRSDAGDTRFPSYRPKTYAEYIEKLKSLKQESGTEGIEMAAQLGPKTRERVLAILKNEGLEGEIADAAIFAMEEGGEISSGDIAERFLLDKEAATKVFEELNKRGFINE